MEFSPEKVACNKKKYNSLCDVTNMWVYCCIKEFVTVSDE